MAEKNKNPAPRDVEAIARNNQLNPPLLRLPAELRNGIYHFTFETNEVVIEPPGYRDILEPYFPRPTPYYGPYPLSLAQTCTQCRYKALPYFWKTTSFQLGYGGYISGLFDFVSQDVLDQIQIIRVGQEYTLGKVLQHIKRSRYQERYAALRRVLMWWPKKDTSVPEKAWRTFEKEIEICFYYD